MRIRQMNVRLNGLKHGARSKIIDMSLQESLVLLPTEGPTAYKKLLANYADKLQPRDEVEVGLVQRIGDLQWRLLRNTKNERVFNEDCLAQAAQLAHPGATEDQICNLDGVNAFRIGSETKLLKEFRREEAAIVRLINASLRELNMFRKLDPLPKQPLTRNAQILGPSQASTQFDDPPTEEIIKIEPVEKKEESATEADDQSQVLTGWAAPQNVVPSPIRAEVMLQAAPMTFAAGASPGS
ncbi:MAG: hypothetical protein NTV52_33565 [Acidobacteria bacterium]|nr:hypothetical protein [Acidobacteriota bacterium]